MEKKRKNPYFDCPNRQAPRSNFADWTPEQREAAQKKSAETRRKNREMKEQLKYMLSLTTRDRSIIHEYKRRGLPIPDEQTVMLANMLKIASSDSKQAVSAATFIRDTSGQKPVDRNINAQTDLESLLASVESDDEF